MKNLIYILIIFLFASSCIPQRIVPAKRKINKLQDRIEKISKYHGFDSVWYEKRKVIVDLPEIRRELKLDFVVNRRTVVDSLLVEYSKGSVDKQTFIERILMETVEFEDDSLKLHIKIYPDFFELDYTIKARKESVEIQIERITVDSGLKYYEQKPFWFIIVLFVIFILVLLYLLVQRNGKV